jgi:hypothetical protein
LERRTKIKLPFYRKFPANPSGATLIVEDQLYESHALIAPVHPEDGKFSFVCLFITIDLAFATQKLHHAPNKHILLDPLMMV